MDNHTLVCYPAAGEATEYTVMDGTEVIGYMAEIRPAK